MIKRVVKADGSVAWRGRLGRGPLRTFDTKREAEEYVDHERTQRRRERAGLPIEAGPITYDALCELFLVNYPAKSTAWTKRMLSYSRKQFGKVPVRSLRPEAIGKWLHGLPHAPKTKQHIIERMRMVLNAGVEWGYLAHSPARSSAIRSPGQQRVEPINPFESWAEVLAVADAIGERYDPLVRFACATGLRPGEWLDLRWSDVDVTTATATIRGTKTAAAERTIQLSQPALRALNDVPEALNRAQRVFPGPQGGQLDYQGWRKHHWRPALAAAEVAYRTPYQMRHTFATLALEAGVPIDAVSKMMGHSSIEITQRYYRKWTRPMMARFTALLDTLEAQDGEGGDAAEGGSALD